MQGVYAHYALASCSLTTLKPFSLSLGEVSTIPIVGGTSLQYLQEPMLLDLEPPGRRDD